MVHGAWGPPPVLLSLFGASEEDCSDNLPQMGDGGSQEQFVNKGRQICDKSFQMQ